MSGFVGRPPIPWWMRHNAEIDELPPGFGSKAPLWYPYGNDLNSTVPADLAVFGASGDTLEFVAPPSRTELIVREVDGATVARLPVNGDTTWEEAKTWMQAVHALHAPKIVERRDDP